MDFVTNAKRQWLSLKMATKNNQLQPNKALHLTAYSLRFGLPSLQLPAAGELGRYPKQCRKCFLSRQCFSLYPLTSSVLSRTISKGSTTGRRKVWRQGLEVAMKIKGSQGHKRVEWVKVEHPFTGGQLCL